MLKRLNENFEIVDVENRWDMDNNANILLQTRLVKEGEESILVSSVFLTLDHAYQGDPVHFEPMVFGRNPDGDEQYRYTTLKEMCEEHIDILDKYLNQGYTIKNQSGRLASVEQKD